MRKMHVGIRVNDLQPSVEFYTRLFGMPPTMEKPDYAKWMLDDPYVNFSLIERAGDAGLHHIGFQVASPEALSEARRHLSDAGFEAAHEDNLTCGYQMQSKTWVIDPQGVGFEHFFTHGTAENFGIATEKSPEIKALRNKALAGTRDR
ncbi:MAG: VOC family protein [Pseudomonadota bacterium]